MTRKGDASRQYRDSVDRCKATGYSIISENNELRPQGLKRLYLEDSAKGLPPDAVVWSLHVTRNWRLTFRIEDGEVLDVDYEDYH